ncbi:hypothetical protein DRN74_01860 [Candidatus Micrarchaeota archaeon]|nr:MAG: hypothetical protein DRN74_01860 [Candidatus Micrarchaeota archaeon]
MAAKDDILFEELVQKKNNLRKKLRDIKKKVVDLKKKRDEKNKTVAENKEKRKKATAKIIAIKAELDVLNKKMKDAPEKAYALLKKEYDRLNWRYQTEVFSRKREEAIVKRLDELELEMERAREYEELRRRYKKLIRQMKALKEDAKTYHEIVIQNAAESEAYHRELVKLYDCMDELKKELSSVEKQLKEEFPEAKSIVRKSQKREMKQKATQILEEFKKGKKKITTEDLAVLQQHLV